jgi:CHAD domain-containing protein
MAYSLRFGQLAESAAVSAHDQLRDAIEQLERRDADPVHAVHEARKDLKKVRALLRLVRPALPRKVFRAENAALRDAGRSISGARDADVVLETAEDLASRYAGRVPEAAFGQLVERLRARAFASRADVDGTIAPALEALRAADARVDTWVPEDLRVDHLVAGMSRAYTDGRDAFAAARKDPTAENLHQWRKRVKDLWYHERLVSSAWPAVLDAEAQESKVLSEFLGTDHDVHVLAEIVADPHGPAEDAIADLAAVQELFAGRRADLQAYAFALGRRVYAERPKAFSRRIGRYLKVAEREQREQAAA